MLRYGKSRTEEIFDSVLGRRHLRLNPAVPTGPPGIFNPAEPGKAEDDIIGAQPLQYLHAPYRAPDYPEHHCRKLSLIR
jgi:hypothetical protein